MTKASCKYLQATGSTKHEQDVIRPGSRFGPLLIPLDQQALSQSLHRPLKIGSRPVACTTHVFGELLIHWRQKVLSPGLSAFGLVCQT